MNYFAHGMEYVENPYFLAGTAAPDWLSVVDRTVRIRPKHAAPHVEHPRAEIASLAQGVLRHHRDDAWFHETPVFYELNARLATLVRAALPEDEGHRPSFLGHILVEILLDAALIAENPRKLEEYYRSMQRLDPAQVQRGLNFFAPRPTERVSLMVSGFCRERFLWDYLEDEKLYYRLNQVMGRVKLATLPASFLGVLPEARQAVRLRAKELLTPPEENVYSKTA